MLQFLMETIKKETKGNCVFPKMRVMRNPFLKCPLVGHQSSVGDLAQTPQGHEQECEQKY